MKPMIWKELRENTQWAVLSAIVLALAYAFDINQWPEYGGPLSYGAYPGASALFTPMVASLLGLVQILPELRRDQWAFLVHRPVSRTVLFWGKAIPGLMLYLAATSVPLIGAALWIHRHFPSRVPFDLRVMQGAFADILTGIIFYFAAVLTAIRPVRWYGSRVLPLGAAVASAILLGIVPHFGYAVISTVLVIILFALAARGSFAHFGEYRGQTAFSKFYLATVLLFGLMAAGGFAVTVAAVNLPNIEISEESQGAGATLDVPIYAVDSRGDMVRARSTQHGGYSYPLTWMIEAKEVAYTDGRAWTDTRPRAPQGSPEARTVQPLSPQDFLEPQTYIGLDRASPYQLNTSYRWWAGRYVMLHVPQKVGSQYTADTCFYYDLQRRVLFYSSSKNTVVAYAGPGGFYEAGTDPARGARFSSPLVRHIEDNLLWFSDGVYRIEPEKRRVTRIVAGRAWQELRDVTLMKINAKGLRYVFVTRESGIEAYSLQGKLLFTIPLTAELKLLPRIKVYVPRSGNHMLLWFTAVPSHYGEPDWKEPSQLIRVSPQGQVIRREALPALPMITPPLSPRDLAAAYIVGLTAPTNAGILFNALPYSPGEGALQILTGGQALHPGITRLVITVGFLTSVFSALAMSWLTRRCSLKPRQRLLWLIVALLFGPCGVLLALAIMPWPARVKCPQCAKLRDVHHALCEHCGEPFPPPVPDGTEIFA